MLLEVLQVGSGTLAILVSLYAVWSVRSKTAAETVKLDSESDLIDAQSYESWREAYIALSRQHLEYREATARDIYRLKNNLHVLTHALQRQGINVTSLDGWIEDNE